MKLVSLLAAVLVGAAALITVPVKAKDSTELVIGHWEGKMKVHEGVAQLALHVSRGQDGKLSATLDSISENELGIAVDAVNFADSKLHFEIKGIHGEYDGKVDANGTKISGTWKQGTDSLALDFARVTPDYVKSITPKIVRVAFVISNNFNMIDFAGPWEVFQDTMDHSKGIMRMLMTVYTVSAGREPVKSTGGATVVPEYTFADAPQPDIVVVGAQSDGSEPVLEWLRKQHASGSTIMSVCTGAAKLAATGLMDGRQATTHHEYVDQFKQRFPKVQWQTSRRYVESGDDLYTAAGLTSGIDLALHLVEKRFGRDVAQTTADYMEYHGQDWKQPNAQEQAAK